MGPFINYDLGGGRQIRRANGSYFSVPPYANGTKITVPQQPVETVPVGGDFNSTLVNKNTFRAICGL